MKQTPLAPMSHQFKLKKASMRVATASQAILQFGWQWAASSFAGSFSSPDAEPGEECDRPFRVSPKSRKAKLARCMRNSARQIFITLRRT